VGQSAGLWKNAVTDDRMLFAGRGFRTPVVQTEGASHPYSA